MNILHTVCNQPAALYVGPPLDTIWSVFDLARGEYFQKLDGSPVPHGQQVICGGCGEEAVLEVNLDRELIQLVSMEALPVNPPRPSFVEDPYGWG